MKRNEVLRSYTVNDNKIVTPGIYHDQPIYLPHFHEAVLSGFFDTRDTKTTVFAVSDADRGEFPELNDVGAIVVEDCGVRVSCTQYMKDEYDG